ncbi:MAG TPA: efflux RND transporter periplasmic adaptor subunit [Nevskiaceae bacterium]|nr:efflux RND transporter periplasmic adaptor subunit [Nevskiaceae bacterium]
MNRTIPLVIVGVAVAVAGGAWLAKRQDGVETSHRHQPVRQVSPQGKVYYTCLMHPQVRKDAPGNCPICGMQLVERHEAPAAGAGDPDAPVTAGPARSTIVSIDPRMVQNLGIRTAVVESGSLASTLEATGSVAVDERRIVAVESRAAGWIERLEVHAVGETVRKGQVLASLYSPDLRAAQEELALAQRTGDATLIEGARTRLRLLGVATGPGASVRGVSLVAPESGVVTELMRRQGEQVAPGTPLLKIADLSTVWVLVDIPEAQAGALAIGTMAQARFAAIAGRAFDGRLEHLYPTLDTQTRSVRARLVFDNPQGLLRPGMFGRVTLSRPAASGAATLVPTEAVIRTGTRSVVIVVDDEGHYRPVDVVVGQEGHDRMVVTEGLQAGQRVVVSGQFLIDSEASLLGAYNRIGAGP